ncbi:hypothetical protein V2J56_07475 [Georgenia sp. MJ206]|uniref:hypothetical protein n=1 Tax=Georgenia wangjunii TaxID=3117730 RepID=UPI002F26C315
MSRLVAAALGAGSSALAAAALRAVPPGGRERWARSNYAGREVSLLGGAAAATATVLAGAGGGGRTAGATALAAAAGGAFGALDDLTEDPAGATKGLRGHLGSLARGRVTTGALKVLGIGAGSLAAAAVLTVGTPAAGPAPGLRRVGDTLARGALIAGTANLLNLFDLRPGRALKVAAGLGGVLAVAGGPGGRAAAGVFGVALTSLPSDLGERTMLGDTGANALGAALGTSLAVHRSPLVRTGALAGVVALTLASERVSFSAVIRRTPLLRRLDEWGAAGGRR